MIVQIVKETCRQKTRKGVFFDEIMMIKKWHSLSDMVEETVGGLKIGASKGLISGAASHVHEY